MTEWLKVHAWRACVLERVPRVRIPLSPPGFPSYGCGRRGFGEPRQARNGATVAFDPCARSHLFLLRLMLRARLVSSLAVSELFCGAVAV